MQYRDTIHETPAVIGRKNKWTIGSKRPNCVDFRTSEKQENVNNENVGISVKAALDYWLQKSLNIVVDAAWRLVLTDIVI